MNLEQSSLISRHHSASPCWQSTHLINRGVNKHRRATLMATAACRVITALAKSGCARARARPLGADPVARAINKRSRGQAITSTSWKIIIRSIWLEATQSYPIKKIKPYTRTHVCAIVARALYVPAPSDLVIPEFTHHIRP